MSYEAIGWWRRSDGTASAAMACCVWLLGQQGRAPRRWLVKDWRPSYHAARRQTLPAVVHTTRTLAINARTPITNSHANKIAKGRDPHQPRPRTRRPRPESEKSCPVAPAPLSTLDGAVLSQSRTSGFIRQRRQENLRSARPPPQRTIRRTFFSAHVFLYASA